MKKFTIFCACCLVILFTTVAVFAQFTGSTPAGAMINVSSSGQIQAMNTTQVKNLSKDAPVILTGNITRALTGSNYTFRDSAGEITIRVTKKTFGGLSIGETDRVVIVGFVRLNKGAVEIEVAVLLKA